MVANLRRRVRLNNFIFQDRTHVPNIIGTNGLHILPTTILLLLQAKELALAAGKVFFEELLGRLDGRRLHNNGRLASFFFVFFFFNVGKYPLSNSFLYPHKHAFHFISKIDSQYESKSERATLIATCFMTILLSFVFLHGERPRGGDQTCTSLCADVRGYSGLVNDYGGLL